MPNNPYSSFDFESWLKRDDADTLNQDGSFNFEEYLRKASEEKRKREEEEERLAQEKDNLEKQRKEELVKATQVNEEDLTYDAVIDSIIQAENVNQDPSIVSDINEKDGSSDYGLLQINSRWVNKGLTSTGFPSFETNTDSTSKFFGEPDLVYREVQDYISSQVPNWNMMADEYRRNVLLNPDINKEVGRIIYDKRGLGQWSTADKVLEIEKNKKRIDNTGDLASQALAGNAPSLDDISLSFTGSSLPSEVDPDYSPVLQRNRDRKKRLEEAERPKILMDKINELIDRPTDLIPFLQTQNEIRDIAEMSTHIDIIKKADEGGYDPPSESVFKVHEWQTKNQAEANNFYKIADVVSHSLPFAGELLLTGGIFTGGRKVAFKGVKEGLKWGLGKQGRNLVGKYAAKHGWLPKVGDIALKSTAAIGASGVQAGVTEFIGEGIGVGIGLTGGGEGGGRIRAATMRNMMDRAGIQEDEKGNLEAVLFEEGDEFWDAFSKGTASVFIENLSERSGLLFTRLGAGKIGETVRKGILEKFLKLNPGSKVADFQNILKKAGWNGVVGEVMEERVGDIGRSLTYNVAGVGDETWRLPDADELGEYLTDIATIEFPAFMIPGGTIGGITAVLARDKSDLSKPTNALKFLNESKYKLKVRKNDKSNKFDVIAIIAGDTKMVSSFDTKKEARDHLKKYAVSEAGQLREVYKQQLEAAIDIAAPETAAEERQVFPEENKQGQDYRSKISKMSPERLEKEQSDVEAQLEVAKTDRQKRHRQRKLSAIEDMMAPAEEVVEEVAKPVEQLEMELEEAAPVKVKAKPKKKAPVEEVAEPVVEEAPKIVNDIKYTTLSLPEGKVVIGEYAKDMAGKKKGDTFIDEIKVDKDKRGRGIGSRLLQSALEKHPNIAGQASNDAAVKMNYKLGMRAFDSKGNALTLEQTLQKRKEQTSVGMRLTEVAPVVTPAVEAPVEEVPGVGDAYESEQFGELVRDVTLKSGKTFPVDASISNLVKNINDAGYLTVQSQSGLKEDYPGRAKERYTDNGYIAFYKATGEKYASEDGISSEQIEDVKRAAEKAGLAFDGNRLIFFTPAVTVRTGITKDGTPTKAILEEAGKLTLKEMGYSETKDATSLEKEEFFEYLDKRHPIRNRLIKEHGGKISNAEIKKRWKIFEETLLEKKAPAVEEVTKPVVKEPKLKKKAPVTKYTEMSDFIIDYSDDYTIVEQLEFSQKNLKNDLKKAKAEYKKNPSFGAQGRIDDIQSQLKGIGFQLSKAKKEAPAAPAVEDTRTTEEIEAENLALQEELGVVETEKEAGKLELPQGMVQEVNEIKDIGDVDTKEQQALERLETSIGVKKFFDSTDPNYKLTDKMNDAAVVGAGIIRRGAKNFKQFSAEMVSKIGKGVKPYLKKLYNNAKAYVREYIKNPKIGLGIKVVQPTVEAPAVEGAPALTPQEKQQEFFKDTKVVDDQENPKVVYHATTNKFEVFDTKGLGSHFGTKEQANNRIDRGSVPRKGRQVIPVYLNIKNPLRLDEPMFGDWENGNQIKRQLEEKGFKGVPAEPKIKRVSRIREARQHLVEIKRYLMDQGYDGIVYENTFESPLRDKEGNITESYEEGTIDVQDSYIAFHPAQAKSIFNLKPLATGIAFAEASRAQADRPLAPKPIRFKGKNATPATEKSDMVYTYIFDKGLKKSQFINDYMSAMPNQKAREDVTRSEYKVNLSKMYDSGKKAYKKGIKTLVKNARDTKGLKETFDSGRHMMEWYDGFYPYMQKTFGKDAPLVADFIAITSAGVELKPNITHGLKAYAQYKLGEEFYAGRRPNRMRDNLKKAVKNHEKGESLSIGGDKISNFSRALKGDANAVTLDMWMAREFGIKQTPAQKKSGDAADFNDAQYRRYEKIIKDLAFDWRVTPRQAQAGIWFGIREGHSPMWEGDPGLESLTYEQIIEKAMPNYTYTDKNGKEHSLTDLNKASIQYLNGSFGLTPEMLDTIGKALVDTGRFAYDTLSPAMQKLGNRLGVTNQNFKLKFAQFKNNAKEMTDATKKWFKKVVGQMRTWFRKNAQKLIESKPMQKAYKRIEDIAVKRIVPEGQIPEVAKSEEPTEKRISAIMNYIDENGLPDKINALKSRNFISKYYSDLMIPISTRLGRIHPELKRIIRKYHERADLNTGRDMLAIEPFVAKMEDLRKSNKKLYDKLDIAMQNGWGETINKLTAEYDADLLKKYGKDGVLPKKMTSLTQDYQGVRTVLDNIYERAVGLEREPFARYRELKDFILPDLKNTPKRSWKRAEIVDWFDRNNVKYDPSDIKTKLLSSDALKKKVKSRAGKYKNLKKEFDSLDAQVAFDIPYYTDYHPREVNDYQALDRYINDNGLEGEFDLAILNKAKSLGLKGDELTDRQKADAISMHLRNTTGVMSTSAKNMKKRKFVDLDIDMSAYYKDSVSSLLSYIPRMNEAISRSKLFNGAGVNAENLTDKDIGSFIAGIKAAQDKTNPIITPEHEKEINEIFMAKFGQGKFTHPGVQAAKNVVYMASIGDIISTLTQLGDLGFATYRSAMAGHPVVLLKAIARGFTGKSLITGKDLGMDRISAEYSRDQLRTSKALGKVFKRTGFARIDRLGKEVLVNSVIESMRVEARRKKGLGVKNMNMINAAFGENSKKAKEVIEDLKSTKKPSRTIISLAYWSLLEHQPVAESEMPAMYLKSDGAKFFYQLKTWGIKALDVYRNEVIDTIFRKKQVRRGLTNLAQLAIAMGMANMPPEYIKSLILGRPFRWKDEWIDSLLRLFFISKYDFTETQLRTGNIRFASKKLGGLMPLLGKTDDVINDLYTVGKWFSTGLGTSESIYYDLRTPTDIPYLGRLLTHRGWDLGMLDWGGAKGREQVIKKEIRHYENILKGNIAVKGRELNDLERENFEEAHRQLGIITAAIAQGSKGGFVWQWLGWDEEDYSERNRKHY